MWSPLPSFGDSLSIARYHRVLRVARTLADLDRAATIARVHIARVHIAALAYRRVALPR